MKKSALPPLAILILIGAVIGILAFTANPSHVPDSEGVSGTPTRHHNSAVVNLPPVVTTTTTTVATPVEIVGKTTTTTKPVVQEATTTTTSSPVKASAPIIATTTTTTSLPPSGSNVTVETSMTGTTTAPDKTECTAGIDQDCVLVTAVHPVINGDQGATFTVADSAGNILGSFVVNDTNEQSFCLIHWLSRPSGTVASSSDCSGGPLESSQTTMTFTYSSPSSL